MIESVAWKANLSVLDPDQLEKIHTASLEILAETGVAMPLAAERYDALEAGGAQVDRGLTRVYFPPECVSQALRTVPSTFTLGARNPANRLDLDGAHGYLTLDGTGVNVLDLETGQVRPSTYTDLADAIRVADALPEIAFLWPCVSAQDKPAAVQPLYELYALLRCSSKHAQAMTVVDPVAATGAVEMAAAVVGGRQHLKENPIISNFQCSISPLSYDRHALEAALVFSAAGIPVGFLNMQIGCATAPATLAGNIAMGNAEILAGITFQQLLCPGAPTFYGSCATMMELRTGGVTAGGPDDFLLQAAASQLAQYYGLPANVGTFATGARRSGWQAGAENAASAAVSQFCRADMMCGAGLTQSATVFSYEQLLLDCEIFGIVRNVAQGIVVDDDTLALPVIKRVGPQNHFMTDPHTIEHLHRIWQPRIIDRSLHDQWVQKGRPATKDHARHQARRILSSHRPEALPQDDVLLEILTEHERKTGSQ